MDLLELYIGFFFACIVCRHFLYIRHVFENCWLAHCEWTAWEQEYLLDKLEGEKRKICFVVEDVHAAFHV